MASRWWLPRGPTASRTNWSCVEKRTRGVVSGGMGFSSAWWETYGDSEHRMLHWLQLVSLANSAPPTSELSIESLVQKEVSAQLRNTDRSRTPLGRGGKGRPQLAAPQQLALPGLAASSSAADMNLESKGKGKRKNKRNRAGKRPPAGRVWHLRDLPQRRPRGSEHAPRKPRQWNLLCLPRRSL